MIVALTNSITLNVTKDKEWILQNIVIFSSLDLEQPEGPMWSDWILRLGKQWTCSLVAFEMIASKTGTRSAITQLSSSKPFGCIRKMIKDEVCDQFVFEWGQVDNSMQSVCDNTAVCL